MVDLKVEQKVGGVKVSLEMPETLTDDPSHTSLHLETLGLAVALFISRTEKLREIESDLPCASYQRILKDFVTAITYLTMGLMAAGIDIEENPFASLPKDQQDMIERLLRQL